MTVRSRPVRSAASALGRGSRGAGALGDSLLRYREHLAHLGHPDQLGQDRTVLLLLLVCDGLHEYLEDLAVDGQLRGGKHPAGGLDRRVCGRAGVRRVDVERKLDPGRLLGAGVGDRECP